MVNKERMLAEFFELVKIKTSSRQERAIADLLKAKLAACALEVSEDDLGAKIGGESGNIIGFLAGNAPAPALLFTAHMDSVECCEGIEPVLKDGIISSAGNTILGSDDKSGVTAILEALRLVQEEKILHGDIQVVFTVAEECGLLGAKHISESLLRAKIGYALDSSGSPGEIVLMAPGQNQLDIIIHGKKAHAGLAPEEGINAIVVAGKCLGMIQDGRIDGETTANVGMIKGGLATNIVPDEVEIKAEARSRNLEKLAKQTEHMQKTFEEVAKTQGAQAKVKISKSYDPYVLAEDSAVALIASAAATAIGLQPVFKGTGGGSDANFFNANGVAMAVLGTGMSKVHTTEEYIKEKDLYGAGELVFSIIKTAVHK